MTTSGRSAPSTGRGLRAFFALDFEPEVRRALSDLVTALAPRIGPVRMRWVAPESWHLTVRFLGHIDGAVVDPLVQRVGAELAAVDRFQATLTPPIAFPSQRRARVIALGVEPVAPLRRLADAVERGVVAVGLPADARPFRPHVTLARVMGGGAGVIGLEGIDREVGSSRIIVDAREVVLFRSDLRAGGAVYTEMDRIPLRVRGPGAE